jgi:RND family efflux transporter MFP subunit
MRLTPLCLLAPLTLASCGGKGAADDAAGAAADSTAVAVALTPVRRDTISETISLVGRLDATPGSSALLAAPTAAIVRRVRAQIGAEVGAGDTIVELDAPELAAQARSDAAAAEVAVRNAARQRALLAQGIASTRQVEEADNAATAARAAAEASGRLLARATVTSPIEGAIQRVAVQPGERVEAGAALAEVMDADTLDLVVPVPAARLPLVRVGQPAWVTAEGDTLRHRAAVEAVAPGIDSITNAGRIVVRMPNPGERIRIGAAATATIELRTLHDVTVVPLAALTLVGDSQTVFIVTADSTAHARAIRVLARSAERAAITGEVRPGEQVVTQGAAGLADGMRVVPAAARP